MAVYLTGRRLLPQILAVELTNICQFPYPSRACLGNPNFGNQVGNQELAVFLTGSRCGVGFGMVRFGSMVYAYLGNEENLELNFQVFHSSNLLC
ncbi:hypothetical protein A2U01_0032542 [Trifolium medium]|uniref:Uncharacterized protein n=1 Tax=Trifolium medium TaxID=97028 RepID=A0A392PI26_9FABA|nr:hypothetical protein [Trifolium medium]